MCVCVSVCSVKNYFNDSIFPNYYYGIFTTKLLSHCYHLFSVCHKRTAWIFYAGIEEFDRKSRNEWSRMSENALAKRRNILWRGGSFESEGGQIEGKKRGRRTGDGAITRGRRVRDRYTLGARFAHNSPCAGNTDAV